MLGHEIASPASFALAVSNGKWVAARHLIKLNRVVMHAIQNPTSPRIIVVEMPPRQGKSEYCSKWLPSWFRGMFPWKRVILTSYESFFAKQWGRKVRNILTEHGEEYFGVKVRADNRSASEWSIEGHEDGSMQTAGAGGALTGKGADLILIDDPIRNAEQARSLHQLETLWDWWESTVATRLEPGGIAIIIATRWHELDISGRLIAASEAGIGEKVTRLRLPALAEEDDPLGREIGEALWPQRFTRERFEEMREAKSVYWWNALYQQRPSQHEGAEWPDEYFDSHLLTEDWPHAFDISAMALDPSKGKTNRSDYSALTFGGLHGGLIWVKANIKRRPIPKMVKDGFWMFHQLMPDAFGIESNAWQDLLAPEFDTVARELNCPPLPIHLIENTVQKTTRIDRIGPYLSRKKIRIYDDDGGRLLVRQLKEHPIGDHDDGPDSLEMTIRLLTKMCHQGAEEPEDSYEIANV